MRDFNPPIDAQIDAALNTYPLASLPPGFIKRTMGRILPKPRFRLEFLDLALPAFLIFFAITIISLGFWLITSLNPIWLLELQVKGQWFARNINLLPLGLYTFVGFAGVCVFLLLGLALALAMDRPIPLRRSF
jgi:hypothetical protein